MYGNSQGTDSEEASIQLPGQNCMRYMQLAKEAEASDHHTTGRWGGTHIGSFGLRFMEDSKGLFDPVRAKFVDEEAYDKKNDHNNKNRHNGTYNTTGAAFLLFCAVFAGAGSTTALLQQRS
jgi:hypothetical protein